MAYVARESDLRENVSKLLYHFGEKGLRAPQSFYEDGHRLGHKLFLTLQGNAKKFKVVEPHFNGSFGKKTDVVQPDLDLVVKFSNYMPPVDRPEEVIEEMHDIIILNLESLEIVEESIVCRKRLIQFRFNNGIEVDLLPAPTLSEAEALELMARNPDDFQTFNICMGTKQVDFIKSHPENFHHALIRILKLWYKSLVGLGKISGGSSLMEVVAIAAAEMEKNYDQLDMCRAFIRAIEWFMNLETVKIAFQEVKTHKWELIPSNQLDLKNAGKLVPKVIGTTAILEQQSFIVDPANPYCDWLPKDSEERRKLIEYAKETRKRFDALFDWNPAYIKFNGDTNVVEVNIQYLFRAQPVGSVPQFPISLPRTLVASYKTPTRSKTNGMQVRNEAAYRREGVKNYVAGLKQDLLCVVQTSLHGKGSGQTGNAQDVENIVKKFVKDTLDFTLVSSPTATHDDKDVTLEVPYEMDGQWYALKISCSF